MFWRRLFAGCRLEDRPVCIVHQSVEDRIGEAHRPEHASAPLLNAAETWRLPADLQLSRRINLIRELGQPQAR
jgi:hypothetical protein